MIIPSQSKTTIDTISALGAIASALSWLPTVLAVLASLMSLAWSGIRMYEYFKNKQIIKGD